MRYLALALVLCVLAVGCKKDDSIIVMEVKQCRDAETGKFVACK